MTLTQDQKKELLSEHFLLRNISDEDLDVVVGHARTQSFGKDETIFTRGDYADEMMVVVSGCVQISSPATDGDKLIFATMMPGDVFGEIALIDGHKRSANAVATEETKLLILSRDDFLGTLQHNPALCIDMLKVLCKRIRTTNEMLEDFTIFDLRRRLAKRLAYLNEGGTGGGSGLKMSVRVSQQELTAMMGVNTDLIDRQLQIWEGDGVLDITDGWITIQDKSRLNHIIQHD